MYAFTIGQSEIVFNIVCSLTQSQQRMKNYTLIAMTDKITFFRLMFFKVHSSNVMLRTVMADTASLGLSLSEEILG